MDTLRERLGDPSRFLVGVELVSIRGSMAEESAVRARSFATELVESPTVDWISITDNAGGNPQLAPQALAKPILYAGKEVVIHLTCKDLNRNALESEAWQLNSEGFHNVLAMTGDYPVSGSGGSAKPVFDLDSIGLLCLLKKMNEGFDVHHIKTQFCVGAVVNPFKLWEGELVPQYLKLRKKTECGASFIITQVGYDARRSHELRLYMDRHGMQDTPLIGNVFVLSPRTAGLFHEGRIPGVVVSDALLDLCDSASRSPDSGREFFLQFAAKQVAIFRGLGYRGAYLGGVHTAPAVERVLEIERTFGADDWKDFVKEIRFSRPGEYFYYAEERDTGLCNAAVPTRSTRSSSFSLHYAVSKVLHHMAFTHGTAFFGIGADISRHAADPSQGVVPVRLLELATKSVMYGCQDCGDCSLPETAYVCPESGCAKNQRNGPCGGTRDGRCEVDAYGECIWMRAYERLQRDMSKEALLDHVPVIQNQALRGTSAWANSWLERDHTGSAGDKRTHIDEA